MSLASPALSRSVIKFATLSNIGSSDTVFTEVSHDCTPSNGWYHDRFGDYLYYKNKQWTGITIIGLDHLFLVDTQQHYQAIVLKRPCYRISFKKQYLIDSPTLKQAKELAEWYYNEWQKVNG
jgi:hypothetical protein